MNVGNRIRSLFGGNVDGLVFGAVAAVAVLLAGVFIVRSEPRAEVELRLADGSVWLPSLAIGGVSLLDGGSGSIATSLGVAGNGDHFDVVQWGSDAILVNETDGTVSRLDGADWSIATGRVEFGTPGGELAVIAGQNAGWLIQPGVVAPLDLDSLELRSAAPVQGQLSEGLVTRDGSLLYSSIQADEPLRRFSPDDGASNAIDDMTGPIALRDLGGFQAGVDLDDRRVWLDGSGVVCSELAFPEGSTLGVGGGDGRLLVVSNLGGLMMWSPSSNGCPSAAEFLSTEPGDYGTPVVTDGWGVIPDFGRGEVIVVDLEALAIVGRQPIVGLADGAAFEVLAETGSVWFNDPNSAAAGLVRRDGQVVPVAKYDKSSDSGFVAAPIDDPDFDGSSIALAGARSAGDGALPNAGDSVALDPIDQPDNSDQSEEGPSVTQPEIDPLGPSIEQPSTTLGTSPVVTSTPGRPSTTKPAPNPTTTQQPVIDVQLASTASQVKAGESITFQSVTLAGNPRFFDLVVSPDTGTMAPLVTFGRFDYTFSSPGDYRVTLTACDPDNVCDSETVAIKVIPSDHEVQVLAAIVAPSKVTVGKEVTFLDATQGDPSEWSWTFEDGSPNSSSNQNPTVTFDSIGSHSISLTARTDDGRSDSATITIQVVDKAPPYVLTIVGDSTVEVGQSVGYSVATSDPNGTPNPHWNVQGADTVAPQGQSVEVSWSTAGTYQVAVSTTGENADGAGTLTVTVTDPPPVVVAPKVSISGAGSLETGEDGSWSVTNSGGPISEYAWTITGGTTGSGSTLNHVFANDGTYTVSVTVTGPGGQDTASRSVTVTVPAPSAAPFDMTCTPVNLNVGDAATCRLVGDVNDFTPLQWSASFPNPASANSWGAFVDEHEHYFGYFEAGQVSVTLSAQDIGTGTTVSRSVTLTFTAPAEPAPEIAISGPASLETGQTGTYSFSNSGGAIDSVSWTSAGQPSGSANDFGSAWNTAGTYTVTLTVSGPTGSDTTSMSVTVAEPPPTPASMGLSCPGPVDAGNVSYCQMIGDPANFSGFTWSINWPDPALANNWAGEPWTMNVGYGAAASFGVTLRATDIATGQTVQASATVTFQ